MKARWMAAIAVAAVMGCETGGGGGGADLETGAAGQGGQEAGQTTAVDTIVTQRTTQDTAIVRTDTTVEVDTQRARGERGVTPADTVRDTRGQTGGQAQRQRTTQPRTDTMVTADTMIRRDTAIVQDTSAMTDTTSPR